TAALTPSTSRTIASVTDRRDGVPASGAGSHTFQTETQTRTAASGRSTSGAISAPTQRTAAAAVPFSLLIQGDSMTRIVPGTSGKEGANGYAEVDARTAGLGRGRGDRQADAEPGHAHRGRERDAAEGARGEARDGLRGARAADDRSREATGRAREAEAGDDEEVDDGAEAEPGRRHRHDDDTAAQHRD